MLHIGRNICAALSMTFCASGVSADDLYDDFERLEGPPYAEALIAYAASLGIEQGDITASIFEGTFVPHPLDVREVKIELDPRSCEAMEKASSQSDFDCRFEKRRVRTPGDAEWNRLFGAPSEEMIFRYAQRHPRERDTSEDSWQRSEVQYEDVKDLPWVKSEVMQVGNVALPSIIMTRSMNDQYGPKDFGGVYQRNRAAFVERRIGSGAAPDQVAGVRAPVGGAQTPGQKAPRIQQEPAQPGVFTPNAQDIQRAVQARVRHAFGTLDAMGEGCNTYRRDNDPVAAVMCLFSGGGAMNSTTGGIEITSVSLDHCVRMSDDRVQAYCRYRVAARMTGSGMMGQIASVFNATSAFNQWTWASFSRDGQAWRLVETWDRCTPTDGVLHCTRVR